MLSISCKKGTSAKDVAGVAKYPDESKDKSKAPGAIEDYYSQGNDKTPSVWMGSAAEALGLKGAVNREDHIRTLMGQDPRSGQGLLQGAGEDRRYAWDLTFSAPKSVSIVWAVGNEDVRKGVEDAQTRAVEKVLEFIEQNFPLARQGSSSKGTIEQVNAKLLAAAFLHGSSRPVDAQSIPDPQLHIHLMLQNMALREDGTWGALNGKQLYEWKMALGAIYRAELAKEIKEMGFQIEADGDYFRIVGIPKELEKETSQRREQILEALEKLGLSGGKASEIANLDNRFDKGNIPAEILQADWDARALTHGVTRETIDALRGLEKEAAKEIDREEILPNLTSMEAIFDDTTNNEGFPPETVEKILSDARFKDLDEWDRLNLKFFLEEPRGAHEEEIMLVHEANAQSGRRAPLPTFEEWSEKQIHRFGLQELFEERPKEINREEVLRKLTTMEAVFEDTTNNEGFPPETVEKILSDARFKDLDEWDRLNLKFFLEEPRGAHEEEIMLVHEANAQSGRRAPLPTFEEWSEKQIHRFGLQELFEERPKEINREEVLRKLTTMEAVFEDTTNNEGFPPETVEKILSDARFKDLDEWDRLELKFFLEEPRGAHEEKIMLVQEANAQSGRRAPLPTFEEWSEKQIHRFGLQELFEEKPKEINREEILRKLTTMEAVFEEKDLFKEASIVFSHQGKGLEDVKKEVAALKRHQDLVKLRGQDGKTYYTTKEMLELEQGILARAWEGKEDRSHVLDPETVHAAIERREREQGFGFSPEQLAAIEYMTRTEGRTKIVQGHAGAGKSTALVPVRYGYEEAGFEVIGCALQGKTAKLMENETGIKSQTIASLLRDLEGYDRDDGTRADPTRKLSAKSVIVVDEAMMCDTRTLDRLQALAHAAGAKLELVGDDRQVPPVAAGSPVKGLMKKIEFVELTENRRQKADWQKQASREIRDGKVKEALEKYAQAGMITIAKDRDHAMAATVGKWAQDFNPEARASLLTAYRKVDVAELNARARAAIQEKGLLDGIRAEVKTSTGIKEFQGGDRIYFSRNNKTMGVMNGETGTLKEIAQDSNGTWLFHVRMDSGKDLSFDPLRYEHFQHGYAITINKSQGETGSQTYNYIGFQGLEQLYVQLTRHKDGAHMVMTEDQLDRAAQAAGVELAPTEKMLSYAMSLSGDQGIPLPQGIESDFDLCRSFLNRHASSQMNERTQEQQEELDFGLEKVRSLIGSIRSREKMNALDFEIEPKAVTSHEKELEIEKETQAGNWENGKEKGQKGRERIRERELERELELGF
jgi:conjugative relaxase-like TrwC/TraI family protein